MRDGHGLAGQVCLANARLAAQEHGAARPRGGPRDRVRQSPQLDVTAYELPYVGSRDFDAMYLGTPPWDIGRPQTAFLEVATAGELHRLVLDVGCGTGEHALMAAGPGLDAMGAVAVALLVAAFSLEASV